MGGHSTGQVITDLKQVRELRGQLDLQPQARILVSACLAGKNVRYDGKHCRLGSLDALLLSGQAILICPEVLGGLPTPRPAAEVLGKDGAAVLDGHSRVETRNGLDLSRQFRLGAERALAARGDATILFAVLKSRSPSCGAGEIYDGGFAGKVKVGNGVAADRLLQAGIDIISSEVWREAFAV
ncbi:MAG: DUF523 domain-containing protein [Vulcanimicrobiota bacterium]